MIIAEIIMESLSVVLSGTVLVCLAVQAVKRRRLRKRFLEAVAKGGHPQVID